MVEAEEVAASDESALASLVAPKLKRRLHFLAGKGRRPSSTPSKRCRLLAQVPCNDAGIHRSKERIKQKPRKNAKGCLSCRARLMARLVEPDNHLPASCSTVLVTAKEKL